MRRTAAILLALTMIAALVGCGGSEQAGPSASEMDAERQRILAGSAKPKRAKKKKATASASTSSPSQGYASVDADYVYEPAGKRDPFQTWFRPQEEEALVPAGPLEQFELGQLAVVAVVWEATRPRALVADPAGRSYVVSEGSRVGKNKGRVIHIGDNLVLVKETYEDFAGERTTKDVELRIRRSQGG